MWEIPRRDDQTKEGLAAYLWGLWGLWGLCLVISCFKVDFNYRATLPGTHGDQMMWDIKARLFLTNARHLLQTSLWKRLSKHCWPPLKFIFFLCSILLLLSSLYRPWSLKNILSQNSEMSAFWEPKLQQEPLSKTFFVNWKIWKQIFLTYLNIFHIKSFNDFKYIY